MNSASVLQDMASRSVAKSSSRQFAAALAAVGACWLRRAFVLCLLAVGGVGSAQAQSCGLEGQRACNIFEHIPSCRSTNLVESAGRCVHPDCGRDGQNACPFFVRIPSCDDSLIEYGGKCYVPGVCGNENQRACTVAEHFPSCRSKNLIESAGKCVHPDCGRDGQNACTVSIRIPSCDDSLIEYGGKCYVPGVCGNENQRACTVAENFPSCRSRNLVESAGRCVHPDCGRLGQSACGALVRLPSCDDNLVEYAGRCYVPNVCGDEGQRGCAAVEHIPSCKSNTLVESGGICTHPACGRENQVACAVNIRIPSCDGSLAEYAGKCYVRNVCGNEGQRGCATSENIPSCKNKNLVESGGLCIHPACGRLDQAACGVTVRVPSCDDNLIEYGGKCYVPNACGNEGQRACTLAEHFPSCRSKLLVETAGMCVHPPCGRVDQAACNVVTRIPSCDDGLMEFAGKCVVPNVCGNEGQRACAVWENVPSCRNGNLIESAGQCIHPPCGRVDQAVCLVGVRIPSCDAGLVEFNGMCFVRDLCGNENQRACAVIERVPSCRNTNLVESSAKCIHPDCGRRDQTACAITVRLPSCDDDLVEFAGKCVPRNECGLEGQRACTIAERIPSCRSPDLVEMNGRCVHPACGRDGERYCNVFERVALPCDTGLGSREDICLAVTACGGKGQRACTVKEQSTQGIRACNAGLIEAAGCTGSCLGAVQGSSSGTCVDPAFRMTEPTTNATPLPPRPNDPLRGYADLHVHMFSHLAFGGGLLAGTPYDPAGAAVALRADYGTDLDLVSIAGTPIPVGICPPLIPNCGKNVLHGDHIAFPDDTPGLGTGDATKANFGAPWFNGWPTWHTTTHQQVYYKWLERAWQSGLRLMVMHAVNNEVLCGVSKRLRGANCKDSMTTADAQLKAAADFEAWLNRQPGGGWFRIVRTPAEAEETIRSGKLAVVLGIEVDNLFNCKLHSNCTPEFVAAQVDKYFEMGVRHIFPIHDFDNGFGGTAVWQDILNIGNRLIANDWYDVVACEPDTSDFKLSQSLLMPLLVGPLGDLLNWSSVPYPNYPGVPACNQKGLTELGKRLTDKLMNLGMIIDIDHMSRRSISDTIAIARGRGVGYPLVAGHATFADLHRASPEGNRNEIRKTRQQLEDIKSLGGMVAIIPTDSKVATTTIQLPGGPPPRFYTDDCDNSSKSLAQSYLYATKDLNIPAAFGSDLNGMAPHYAPRFGDDACNGGGIRGQWQAQLDRRRRAVEQPGGTLPDRPLGYPFKIAGMGTFDRQVTGQRVFDFNTDGFAHIGLYPDLIADLPNVGVAESDLEPLFHSASAYVTMWKRARSLAARPTPPECADWHAKGLEALFREFCSGSNGGFPVEPNTDRPGLDYRNFPLPPQPDPTACRAACQAERQCVAWTYVKSPNNVAPAVCWLKRSVPPPVPNNCCTSGVK